MPGYPFQRRTYWTGPELVEIAGERADDEKADGDEGVSAMTGAQEEALAHVIRLTADHLGLEEAECGAEVPFFDLGADSLRMINLLQDLEHAFGVKVAVRELFEEADTPLSLARLLVERGGGGLRRVEPAPGGAAVASAGTASEDAPAVRTKAGPAVEQSAAPAAGSGPFATQASLDALTAQVNQLMQIQMQLMQQVSDLLATGLRTSTDGQASGGGTAAEQVSR